MSFQHCLRSLKKKGANPATLHLVATFLTNRTMSVKVESTQSKPREVWGGCPQGSILGVFLFNATIDDLEEDCEDLTIQPTGIPDPEHGLAEDSESDTEEEIDSMMASTPAKETGRIFTWADSPVHPPGFKKKRKSRKKVKRLDITGGYRQEVPEEPNARTEAKWLKKLGALLRYIDDGFSITKVNFENSFGMTVNGVRHRIKHAIQAQNIFRHLVRRAEDIGIVVNSSKTAMICVSDSLAYEADAFIQDADGNRIGCQKTLKALGMHFSSRPDMNAQVESIKKKYQSRFWILRNLKKSGFTLIDTVYKTMTLPVADYGAVVYHSSLTDGQEELLDGLQNAPLKCIFGPGISGRKMREMAGLETLRKRRENMCLKFAKKCTANPLFATRFPLKTARSWPTSRR